MIDRRPKILVVEDDAALREALTDTLELAGHRVVAAPDGETALVILGRETVDLVLSDVQMPGIDGHELLRRSKIVKPGIPFVLMTAYGQIERAVAAMRGGAADYLAKPFEPDRLLAAVARYLPASGEADDLDMIAEGPAMRAVLEMAARVAVTDATVLLTGESGVGKEVVARYLHRHSPRRDGPFVAVNCAAIPETLVESTLFGHEKGAFTGAAGPHAGKFEQAQGGTLLLDEVSEIPLNIQAKLLRILQEKVVERLGGRATIPLDVRVLAASNRDLTAWVREGRFREDLYYRLNVFPLNVPPLRQRGADILPLARHFLKAHAGLVGRDGFVLSHSAKAQLTAYEWPGNVRELSNVMQRAMILAASSRIEPENLFLPGTQATRQAPPETPVAAPHPAQIRDVERAMILATLERLNGSRKETAKELGISERTLRYKLQRYREEGGSEDECSL
ncbi:MAG: sigma-54-dependent Fis family transcriptional regulator [Hydrogenophilales bacterium CG03_land_8_20_14_0_80_62_28]|nr:sigma-54-dependent Fis family transcriptional regulator [Betaproteobacteria bacterium]PIV23423.1 MAG: sigma-54-dependent Fis family transcriptional regulator [Hydrogenophilales bacterium CG03_land_8_20_14_0_80_62_28]PIW37733.1 MAG: sigma-54-dependent Fis family transcriptional regulator [Hydrogenophilales bacterium CG15_BIG_FIL_POST_REV_8_21_14_020_62_31]PIW71553.1 MAG: sigma-54-dependent Fis family transcriptional regulator [Hydrogenophilales bacterium CG12_big_fil_rev_8_21_14_0_65_61_21]PI